MNSLITYYHTKSKEAGYELTMSELRDVIEKDFLENKRLLKELNDLHKKTYQFEEMQAEINSHKS